MEHSNNSKWFNLNFADIVVELLLFSKTIYPVCCFKWSGLKGGVDWQEASGICPLARGFRVLLWKEKGTSRVGLYGFMRQGCNHAHLVRDWAPSATYVIKTPPHKITPSFVALRPGRGNWWICDVHTSPLEFFHQWAKSYSATDLAGSPSKPRLNPSPVQRNHPIGMSEE